MRKKPAGGSQIEGVIQTGERMVLVDDVMAGGRSAVKFCLALVAPGAVVKDVFIVFDYGTFPTSEVFRSRVTPTENRARSAAPRTISARGLLLATQKETST